MKSSTNYKTYFMTVNNNEQSVQQIKIKEPILKRPFDIFLSLIGLIVSCPIWFIVAMSIWIEGGRPIFYAQKRLGKDRKQFWVFKFRSMIKDAEQKTGPVWANKDDHRITKVGKFIRTTALDELPQLLNILKGDMSFVGPRPERPEIADEVAKATPGFNLRLLVRPGLTGSWQVYGNYNDPPRNRLRYDLLYIKNPSFLLDIKLILLSFWMTFTFRWSKRYKKVDILLGQIILQAGLITNDQLKEALEHQKVRGGKIGENLIRMGYISEPELRHFLNAQVVENGRGIWMQNNKKNGIRKLVGQIMLEAGVINEKQLQEALERQKKHGGMIGENLIRMKYISDPELDYFLKMQH